MAPKGLARSALAGVLLLAPLAQPAGAQDWPARQVTFVLPFAPGGAIDLCARFLAQRLSDRLGKPFVVENRPGAGTVVASNFVAKAPPDGHTILVAPSPLATNATLYKQLPYDPAKDFAPIARVADIPFVLVVHPSLPVHTVPELIRYAKERPGQLTYASSG
jgi:tripartite-type tricarboxylate transporter receptor subunit TctC